MHLLVERAKTHLHLLYNDCCSKMHYFVRMVEKHKESSRAFSPEIPCSGLQSAVDEAKRRVLQSDPAIMLQADACFKNRDQVRTKYSCWFNERGEFQERSLS